MNAALSALADLDSAPATPPSDAAERRRLAMLERIVATPQTPAPSRPTRSPGRARRRIVVAAVGATVVLVPALLLGIHRLPHQGGSASAGLTSADLASWVSTSTPRDAAQLSASAKRWCIDATDGQAGSRASVRIEGGDQRGEVATMLITRGSDLDLCLADQAGGGGYWELVSSADSPLPTVPVREVLLQSAGQHGSDDVGTAWGQIGSDIEAVVLHLGHRDVDATVTDGIWSAWWPAAVVGDDSPTSATVTYTDGRTATVPVHTL